MLRALLVLLFSCSLLTINSSLARQNTDNNSNEHNMPLRIAVATNFSPVLKILLADFSRDTGIQSQIISGASGTLFLQIKHGAPFDIFLSADSRRPKALEQGGYALNGSRKTYATGQLALYSSSGKTEVNSLDHLPIAEQLSLVQLAFEQRRKPSSRFAIANPDIAPYGKAAKETLSYLGLWQRYQPLLIKGLNIGQTFMQLRSKSVASGLVANSQLVLNNLSGVIIPNSYHQPIEQQLIIVGASKNQAAAKKLSDYLLSSQSQAKIMRYGYAKISTINEQKKVKQVNP